MKIKKLLIILILVLMIFPIKTNAAPECLDICSNTKCRDCCDKFADDKSLGVKKFNVSTYKNTYSNNCSNYISEIKKSSKSTADNSNGNLDCDTLLGDVTNDKSLAWMIQQVFNIVKYAGPFLVLVLSSVDFAKTIVQNDEETMKKAQKKLIIRLIAMVLLFFIPDLVFTLLNIFGMVSNDPTCGIS